jgi:hypothetical protein
VGGFAIEVKQYEFGWYIVANVKITSGVTSSYCTDSLMCQVLNMMKGDYRQVLKDNGAVDTANNITYFQTKEEAEIVMPIISDLLEASRIMMKLRQKN